jgi:uncharacterized protein (DUF4415 family)
MVSSDYSTVTSPDPDDAGEITQADLDRATYRIARKPQPRKQRITILLDAQLIDYFKAQAGERGYQTLINDTLRKAVEQEDLETRLRRVIREEMGRYTAPSE